MANFWAAASMGVFSIFGGLPLYIAVAAEMGLEGDAAATFLIGVFGTTVAVAVPTALVTRKPALTTITLPPALLAGAMADRFTFPEIVGANLVAASCIVVIGLLGLGKRVVDWIPLPIVMGMFAGTILKFVTRAVEASTQDAMIVGAAVGGYLFARTVRLPGLPPVALALLTGGVAVAVSGAGSPGTIDWSAPSIVLPSVAFSYEALLAIVPPMLMLTVVLGNVEGFGFLRSQGYEVAVNPMTVVSGVHSLLAAALGATPGSVARVAIAILGGPDAGPRDTRYWAVVFICVLWLPVIFGAGVVASLLDVLPGAYIVTMGGLAILASLQSAFERAFSGDLRFASLIAFTVAVTPITALGMPSAFWAIPAGIVAALAVEREDLIAHWRPAQATPKERGVPVAGRLNP